MGVSGRLHRRGTRAFLLPCIASCSSRDRTSKAAYFLDIVDAVRLLLEEVLVEVAAQRRGGEWLVTVLAMLVLHCGIFRQVLRVTSVSGPGLLRSVLSGRHGIFHVDVGRSPILARSRVYDLTASSRLRSLYSVAERQASSLDTRSSKGGLRGASGTAMTPIPKDAGV
jgi:hypothetical protein